MKPETVVRWHRAGFRLYWRWRSRQRGGRPRISEEMRLLKGYIDETHPYSTMARQLIEPFAQKHDLP